MAISLQSDPTLPRGYILVDGQNAATVTTTGLSASTFTAAGSITVATNTTARVISDRASDNTSHPEFLLRKSRGTQTAKTTVLDNDGLGMLRWFGYDGLDFKEAGRIDLTADDTVTTNSVPSRMTFFTTPVGGTEAVERMRINSAGNVGINITEPTAQLQVQSTSEGGYCIQAQSPNESGAISLRPDGTNGNILRWGGGGALSHALRLQRTGDNEVARFGFYTGTTTGLAIGTTSVSHQLRLGNDSAGKPGTNTWAIVSDERIKENINLASIDRCYEIVKDLPLKRFTWKNEIYSQEQVGDRSKLGWVAQDVQTVFPKGVEIKTMTFSPSGAASEITIEDCLTLNSDQIYAAMYGAIQKLINIVETQSAQISALQEQINS